MSEELITSRHNQRVKDAAKLRDRRAREKQGRTLIDGARELDRAIRGGARLTEAFLCESLCTEGAPATLLPQIEQTSAVISHVTPEVFEKLAFGARTEGVVGVIETPTPTLSNIRLPAQPIVAVVEGIEKPGNLGAVLRSADAAAVSAVIVSDARTDLFNPAAIRASLGTIFALPVAAATSRETHQWLVEHELPIYAARPDATVGYTDVDWRAGGAIVLGSEAAGLSDQWQGDDISPIRLPMYGLADSLNVSATAAVLFYEALRQRDATD